MKTDFAKDSFFKWINSYEGELIIDDNKIINKSGDLLYEFNNQNDENLLKAANVKIAARKHLIDYFTELTIAAGVIHEYDDVKLVVKDNVVYYINNEFEIRVVDMSLDQLFILGTIFK